MKNILGKPKRKGFKTSPKALKLSSFLLILIVVSGLFLTTATPTYAESNTTDVTPPPKPQPKTKPASTPVGQVQPGQTPLEGTFYFISGGPDTNYFLNGDNGKITSLTIDPALLERAGGRWSLYQKRVRVTGVPGLPYPRNNPEPGLQVSSIQLLPLPSNANSPQSSLRGNRPFVNILCKFSDVSAEPQNNAYFTGLMSSTYPGINHYFQEVSYGALNIDGTVVLPASGGWFTLPQTKAYYVPGGSIDFNKITADCTSKAAPFVNFNNFQGINMMFNADMDGTARGGSWPITLSGTSKNWPMTWMPPWGYGNQTVLAHEMGHAFGMPHSANAAGTTYGSVWDVMSDTWTWCSLLSVSPYSCIGQHETIFHKDIPGWIPAYRTWIPSALGGTQTIHLERSAQPGSSGYLMAKIPIAGSFTNFYTVEARQRVGYDLKLPDSAVIINKVDISRLDPAWVVNASGSTDSSSEQAKWKVGETFTDGSSGVSVSVVAATATGFDVSITSPALASSTVSIMGASLGGNIPNGGGVNWFKLPITTAGNVVIETTSGTLDDTYLELYGSDSTTLLTSDDDGGLGLSSRATYYLNPGTYYVRVRAYDTSVGATWPSFVATQTGTYTIRASYINKPTAPLILTSAFNPDNTLQTFIKGTDGAPYTKIKSTSQVWSASWTSLGGGVTHAPIISQNRDGSIELFVRGTDNVPYRNKKVGSSFSGWVSLGGAMQGIPQVAINPNGTQTVLIWGLDNAPYVKTQNEDGSWPSGWTSLGGGLSSNPILAYNKDGTLQIFVRGLDGALYTKQNFLSYDDTWGSWVSLGGGVNGLPAVGQNSDGTLEVFVRGTDNALYSRKKNLDGTWGGWTNVGGGMQDSPSVGQNPDGTLEVFVRGLDNGIYSRKKNLDGSWGTWTAIPGATNTTPVVTRNADGTIQVFVRGSDGAPYTNRKTTSSGGWTGWVSLGGALAY